MGRMSCILSAKVTGHAFLTTFQSLSDLPLHISSIGNRGKEHADQISLASFHDLIITSCRRSNWVKLQYLDVDNASMPHQPIASDPCASHQGTILTQNGGILLLARAFSVFRVVVQRRAGSCGMGC
jgi:hypothetical protein